LQGYRIKGWERHYNITIKVDTGIIGDPLNDVILLNSARPSAKSKGGAVHATIQGDFMDQRAPPALE
jgi:hypothetical protein